MSGTSLDGVDAAVIETDGRDYIAPLGFISVPYTHDLRESLRSCLGQRTAPPDVIRALTEAHLEVFKTLTCHPERSEGSPACFFPNGDPSLTLGMTAIDLIGFHGQTIYHNASEGITIQIGDPAWLAAQTGIPVVGDFRVADVAAGGQGAPLIPLYHKALASNQPKPLRILNLGGVGNMTWIGEGDILAFDTGPANALLDDFIRQRTGLPYDKDGAVAAQGTIHENIVLRWLSHPFFQKPPPKSLDRNDFAHCLADIAPLTTPDGAATLTAFTARSALHWPLDGPLYATGGGRHNTTLMRLLNAKPVEALGWDGDALEAQGFAYLAVRSLLGLPLSLPTTTGVPCPTTGGRLYNPPSRSIR